MKNRKFWLPLKKEGEQLPASIFTVVALVGGVAATIMASDVNRIKYASIAYALAGVGQLFRKPQNIDVSDVALCIGGVGLLIVSLVFT
ncbi:MAG: hypothetical protein IJF82_08355 [Achromobacter sp.]|uniref:hypothetical protein n=1 Tax=Achromobacter dolens TaxID=1287738 RepID=UPI0013C2E1AC|nr:hypothetical protein [Achromobacter dolens]MBQ2647373.1 hypothetical protein [Achromobacter sp.]